MPACTYCASGWTAFRRDNGEYFSVPCVCRLGLRWLCWYYDESAWLAVLQQAILAVKQMDEERTATG